MIIIRNKIIKAVLDSTVNIMNGTDNYLNDGTIHTDIPSFLFKDEKIFKSIKNKKTKGK